MSNTTVNDVYKAYINREYENQLEYPTAKKLKTDYVFDEDKSVKWNKEEVAKYNQERKRQFDNYKEESNRLFRKLDEDVVTALTNEYYLSKEQAEMVYRFAYREKHSCMSDVFGFAEEVAQLVQDIMTTTKTK